VTVSSGHFTSLEKTTPRAGRESCRGVSRVVVEIAPKGRRMRRMCCMRISVAFPDVGVLRPTGLRVR
jgi:hypothetical protein